MAKKGSLKPRIRGAADLPLSSMTLRDAFAMRAMNVSEGNGPEAIADRAYAIADAMIARRKEVPSNE